jgi:eukaryotic-like serine/threonine-protein kinase
MAETLGPYELRGELGRGAMAVVWRAFDPNLEREVAIKEPLMPVGMDAVAADEFAERFVREGKAAARLNHPGIITIYAAGVYDGRPAIVMELVEGETLGAILDRGALEPASVVAVLDQLLDAAAYAHGRGVVHRDIKPDNVFVSHDGRVKLADFGIAHVGADATLTQAGTVMGTPGYMSPEQVLGQAADERSDVFAIGVVGYEMVTGRNPFGATEGLPPTSVMYQIVHEAPAEFTVGVFYPLADDIGGVLETAMEKQAEDRFADAVTMRAALHGDWSWADDDEEDPADLLEEPSDNRTGFERPSVVTGVLLAMLLTAVAALSAIGLAIWSYS